MPLEPITELSDDDTKKPTTKPAPTAPTPKPAPKKVLPKKKATAKPAVDKGSKKTQKVVEPLAETKPDAEPATVELKILKKPSASTNTVKKRPACCATPDPDPTKVRAYKYLYHKKGMYGIKVDKREVLTAPDSGFTYYYTIIACRARLTRLLFAVRFPFVIY